MPEKINLLYDATEIAIGEAHKHGRTGVYMVSINVFQLLSDSPKFNICLYFRSNIKRKTITESPIFSGFPYVKVVAELGNDIKVHIKKILKPKNPLQLAWNILILCRLLLLQCYNKLVIQEQKKRLLHMDAFFSPFTGETEGIKRYTHIKTFMILYDTIPLLFSQYFNDPNFILIRKALNTKTWYFAISNNTKMDFLKHFGDSLDKDKIYVSYIATAQIFKPMYDKSLLSSTFKKYNIDHKADDGGGYLFSLCSIEPRKNLLFAIKCFIEFIKAHKITNLYFYLAGGAAWDVITQKIEHLFTELGDYRKYVVFLGHIDDSDVNILLSNSLFFVYLSQYEGFGMPPLEAMQAGTPVITSNNSSLPEVVGDAAITIDYDSEEQCLEAFRKFYFNADLRRDYIERGLERAKLFSWEKTVKIMSDVILDVVSNETK